MGPYVEYFDLAVVAPGLLAAVLMLLAAACSLPARKMGRRCCCCLAKCCSCFALPKCALLFGDLALLLGLVLYAGFASLGLSVFLPAISLHPAAVDALCATVVPQLQQVLADATQAVANAESVG